ncbi:MAG: peptidoglycan-binding protein [Variibacter sp.]|nr:peptidoglycan-binding protein [Variibacter sp.]
MLLGLGRCMWRRPVDTVGAALALALIAGTLANALYLQQGPHPAPLLAPARGSVGKDTTGSLLAVPRPRPAEPAAVAHDPAPEATTRAQLLTRIQAELARRKFYDGAIDGVYGPRMSAAIREFERAAGMRQTGEPTEAFLKALLKAPAKISKAADAGSRKPDAAQAAPQQSRKVLAMQRALTDFGYGPVKLTGVLDASTKAAIEKFERERKLPVKGQMSARLMHELAKVTGRSFE